MTRLIGKMRATRRIAVPDSPRRNSFPTRYTTDDVARLAETDNAHSRLAGAATRKIFRREYELFGKEDYIRLKDISIAHLYNLRGRRQYLSASTTFKKTNPTPTPIGERRKPFPNGKPGYIRVDSVHQGDFDGTKGVYHINLVDEVAQWELVGSVEGISEAFLAPLLEELLRSFPFTIIEFHSDNGSEIHQPSCGGASQKNAHQPDEVAFAPLKRQRARRRKEWKHYQKAHGVYPYSRTIRADHQ